jgi:KaiB domain
MIDTLSEIDLGIRAEDHIGRHVLRPLITEDAFQARKACRNVRNVFEDGLHGRNGLEVIDIFQQPEPAWEGWVLDILTSKRKHPSPLREPIGDLSDRDGVDVSLKIMPDRKEGNN